MEEWTNVIDSGVSVDVIYLDFQKVFHHVPHGRSFSKVKSCAIEVSSLRYIQDFWSNRETTSSYQRSYSSWISATSGVPLSTYFLSYLSGP